MSNVSNPPRDEAPALAHPGRLRPDDVRRRLDELRSLWTPLTADEANALMAPPPTDTPFEVLVARRLEDLRALLAMTRTLHDARRDANSPSDTNSPRP